MSEARQHLDDAAGPRRVSQCRHRLFLLLRRLTLEGKTGPADPGHRLAMYLLDYLAGKRSDEAMEKYWDRSFAEAAGSRMTG